VGEVNKLLTRTSRRPEVTKREGGGRSVEEMAVSGDEEDTEVKSEGNDGWSGSVSLFKAGRCARDISEPGDSA
jgi:hypothetical protein